MKIDRAVSNYLALFSIGAVFFGALLGAAITSDENVDYSNLSWSENLGVGYQFAGILAYVFAVCLSGVHALKQQFGFAIAWVVAAGVLGWGLYWMIGESSMIDAGIFYLIRENILFWAVLSAAASYYIEKFT